MLFNLRDYKKCFLLQKSVFQKLQPFPNFYNKSVGMLFNLRGLQEMFSFLKKLYSKIFNHFPILAIVFKNLLPIPNFSHYLGNLGLFYCEC